MVYNYTTQICVFPSLAPPRTYVAPRPRKDGVLHSGSPLAFQDMTLIPHFVSVNYLPRMHLESRRVTVFAGRTRWPRRAPDARNFRRNVPGSRASAYGEAAGLDVDVTRASDVFEQA